MMKKVSFLDLHAQYLSIKAEIDEAIASVITSSAFVGGAFVARFEEEFARYLGISGALGVGNGTDALEIALSALELPAGSEVLVPANSFAASAEAVINNRLKVVFVDCGEDYTMEISDLSAKITPQTSAILVVHLYGRSADMGAIMALAREHNLRVIEDCAQAHGATYQGRKVGTFGDVGCFSFYPGKNLGAYGDGGMIVSENQALLSQCRRLAHHGTRQKYKHEIIGRNSRLDGLQAAILSVKLRHLDEWIERRRAVASGYAELLAGVKGIVLPPLDSGAVWHLYVIRLEGREARELARFLEERGVESGFHYPVALPKQEAFARHALVRESATPRAVEWDSHLISLPMGEHLGRDEVERVAQVVRAWCEG